MRGLLVDLDGTLADTMPVLRSTYEDFLRGFGLEGSSAEFARLSGPPIREVVRILQETYDINGGLDDLVERYVALFRGRHAGTAPTRGARRALVAARVAGWRVGVVTSGTHALADAWLRRNRFEFLVDDVVGADDVTRWKPDPEPYRLALARLGCTADISIAVEDSEPGARSALAAGIRTFVLGDSHASSLADDPHFAGALPDMEALLAVL